MNDAFPDDVTNAEWFYPPERNTTFMSLLVGGTGFLMWLGLAYLFAKN